MNIESLETRLFLTVSDPDPTFGIAAVAACDFFGSDDSANNLLVQPDGKVLAVGSARTDSGGEVLAVARFNADGSLDTSFSGDGRFHLGTDGNDNDFSRGFSIKLLSNGDILAGGTGNLEGFLIAKVHSDGTLDNSFGANGVATIPDVTGKEFRQADSIEVLASGKILVAGLVQDFVGTQAHMALGRYNSDGTLDGTFGSGGTLVSYIDWNDDGEPMVVQSDGKILLCGRSVNGRGAVSRYSADGAVDSTFAVSGTFTTVDTNNGLKSVKLRSDGKIMLVGWHDETPGGDSRIDLYRLTTSGTLDTTFDGDGLLTIDTPETDTASYLTIRSDNTMLVGGTHDRNSAIYALKADNSLDSDFGIEGILTLFGGRDGAVTTIDADGKIIVAVRWSSAFEPIDNFQIVRLGNDHITVSGGTLTVLGTVGEDFIGATAINENISVTYDGAMSSYAPARVTNIVIDAGAGNDSLSGQFQSVRGTISAGAGDDLVGMSVASPSTLSGGAGNDNLTGLGSQSGIQIEGGDGDDTINGTELGDTIYGGAGRDEIFGRFGSDRITGGGGKDRINGGNGNDRIYGGENNDQLDGGAGNDRIYGQDGDDRISGGTGNDTIDGGAGREQLLGNTGEDLILALDTEVDTVNGGTGFDQGSIDSDDVLTGSLEETLS